MSHIKELTKGIFKENPTFIIMLGMCPTLGVSTQVSNALGMGVSVIFVLTCSNIFISLLRKIIPDSVRIPSYIVELSTSGYGGAMTVVASYKSDGTLMEAKLTSNSETPGLGKKAEEGWYMDMFKGLGGSSPLPASKSDLSAEDNAAVSGASVTFGGVSSALISGSEFVKGLGGAV